MTKDPDPAGAEPSDAEPSLERWDAIVVGAGPAGSSAAFFMALAGLRVLVLERKAFPRDKSCGDGLTRSAVKLLDEMGVLARLACGRRINGVRVHMRGRGTRDFPFPSGHGDACGGLVVPRVQLDEILIRRSEEVGAVVREGQRVTGLMFEGDAVVGVTVRDAHGDHRRYRARVVIAADGANSHLASLASLRPEHGARGSAVRQYFEGIDGLEDRLEFTMVLTDPTDRYLLPSYGWVFPTGPGRANVGVGLFERVPHDNVRNCFDRFVRELFAEDPRFHAARPLGKPFGAPLRFDFDAGRVAREGLLLVGDAAGMVSPFTGEGISYALASGKLAAETTARWFRHHRTEPPDGKDYAFLLEQRFAGYFDSGHYSSQRYRLIWHVMRSTFGSDNEFHALCRRLLLVPDDARQAPDELLLHDVGSLMPRGEFCPRADLARVGQRLTSSVRKDWPFLARLSLRGVGPASVPLRPSLLLVLSRWFGSVEVDPEVLSAVGAAIELGYLSYLAQTGVVDDGPECGERDHEVSWGNMFSVLVAEVLLAKAYELASRAGAELVADIAASISDAMQRRVEDVRAPRAHDRSEHAYLDTIDRRVGALGELPCSLGARLAGAPRHHVEQLGRYGRHLAIAHVLTNEVLRMEGTEDHLLDFMASSGSHDGLDLPIIKAMHSGTDAGRELTALIEHGEALDRERIARLVRASNVLDGVRAVARRFGASAVEALDDLPRGPARVALERLALYVLDRQAPEPEELSRYL